MSEASWDEMRSLVEVDDDQGNVADVGSLSTAIGRLIDWHAE